MTRQLAPVPALPSRPRALTNIEPPPLPPIPSPPRLRSVPLHPLPVEDDRPTEVMERFWFLDEPELERAEALATYVLPPPKSRVERALSSPTLMHYNRLIMLALVVNVLLAVQVASTATLETLSHLVLGNFAVAIVIRQHYVINLLFWIATRAPTHWPLAIRRQCAKVYHFGGIHVGCAIAGTAWFIAFAVHLFASGGPTALLVVVGAQLAVLLAITVMSMPPMRAKHHDAFELVKRFGGWTSLALFWAQTVMLVDTALSPEVFVLGIVTFSVALPWLRLRKVPVELVIPSKHVALARFDYGVTPFAGSSTAISRSPLREWHSFANVPSPGQTGFRLTISRAGDWTGKLIDDRPSHVWVKGIPTAGVANIETLFTKVVYIATGSGIGPCLPHLLACKVPAKLVWATRDPRATYGDALVDEILAVHPDALIWDTHKQGKPDLVKLAHRAYVESGAEAVICISNKSVTWQVVSGMESRGIPAYGAIWDS